MSERNEKERGRQKEFLKELFSLVGPFIYFSSKLINFFRNSFNKRFKYNNWDLEPLDLLNGLALGCYQQSPVVLIVKLMGILVVACRHLFQHQEFFFWIKERIRNGWFLRNFS